MTLCGILLLADAYVIDEHFVRELCVVDIKAGPVSSDCDIQQKEEWLVEFFGVAFIVFNQDFMVHEVVDEHADVLFVPCEFVCVELRDVELEFLVAVIAGVVPIGRVFGAICPVVCTVDFVLGVDGFDDVDFAAGGPSDCVEVFAEHPEGGPNSLAGR